MTPSQRLWGERNLILSGPIMHVVRRPVPPGASMRGAARSGHLAAVRGPADMPPAIFTIGTADPLLDDTLFMEARWRSAGHPTELRVWPEAPHGFVSLPMSVADVALGVEHDFLRRTLGVDRGSAETAGYVASAPMTSRHQARSASSSPAQPPAGNVLHLRRRARRDDRAGDRVAAVGQHDERTGPVAAGPDLVDHLEGADALWAARVAVVLAPGPVEKIAGAARGAPASARGGASSGPSRQRSSSGEARRRPPGGRARGGGRRARSGSTARAGAPGRRARSRSAARRAGGRARARAAGRRHVGLDAELDDLGAEPADRRSLDQRAGIADSVVVTPSRFASASKVVPWSDRREQHGEEDDVEELGLAGRRRSPGSVASTTGTAPRSPAQPSTVRSGAA